MTLRTTLDAIKPHCPLGGQELQVRGCALGLGGGDRSRVGGFSGCATIPVLLQMIPIDMQLGSSAGALWHGSGGRTEPVRSGG